MRGDGILFVCFGVTCQIGIFKIWLPITLIEMECNDLFTSHLCAAIIPAGVNINHMSSQVKVAVEDEQKKVLWIPFAGNNSATTSI